MGDEFIINQVKNSPGATISMDDAEITVPNQTADVHINELANADNAEISMNRARIVIAGPLNSTVAFNVDLGRPSEKILLNYDPLTRIGEIKKRLSNEHNLIKNHRLYVVGTDPKRYIGDDPDKNLQESGVANGMELRVELH